MSGFTRLEILSLASTHLEGSIPNEWGGLIQLKLLYLSDMSGVYGVFPLSFRLLTNLNSLVLYQTPITGTIPDFSGDLVSLENLTPFTLDLVSGTIPTKVGFWTNLGDISNSRIDL